ncbi:hypothetical protein Tco_1136531 [Tanacetum coccineum]
MVETFSSVHDLRLPLPPEERCGNPHHFINCLWDFVMETFDELRVCNSMHESGDSHAFWSTLDIPAFQFISFPKVFCRLSLPLFDVMDSYGIFNAFLLL